MRSPGVLFCLASAAAFGAMGIFGKLAYQEGMTTGTVLATRFILAAALFWVIAAISGGAGEVRRLSRRDVLLALALGAFGYAAQAGGFFVGLQRLDPSLLVLLIYTFPAIVAVAAIALGRERASARTAGAIALASAGLVLVLSGAAAGTLDPLGTVIALATAVVYATYILCSEGVAGRASPFPLSALVCTGAAVTLTGASLVTGDLDPGATSAEGWLWLAGIAVVSTVAALALFFAGLQRVGSTAASILCTAEPVVTVALTFVVFGEGLGPTQLLGGLLVIAAVIVLRTPLRRRRAQPDAAPAVRAPLPSTPSA